MASAEQLLPNELQHTQLGIKSKITLGFSILTAFYTLGVSYYSLVFTCQSIHNNENICWNELDAPSVAILIQLTFTILLSVLIGHITCLYQNYLSWYHQEGTDYRLFWTTLFRINFTTLTLISFLIFSSDCYYFWSLYTLSNILNILFYTKYSI